MFAGYILASSAAGGAFSIVAAFQSLLTMPINPDPADVPLLKVFLHIVIWVGVTFFMGLLWAICIGIFALLPSAFFIGLGEFLSIRLSWYYALAGAIAGVVALFIPAELMFPYAGPPSLPSILNLIAVCVPGFVGGLVYWRFAGQEAWGPIALCPAARSWLAHTVARN